jgi:hypothetical protein
MSSLESTFESKYKEFLVNLNATFPELGDAIMEASELSGAAALKAYSESVFMKHAPISPELVCPGIVLPGVVISEELWGVVTDTTKRAVYDYLSILDLSALYS